MEELKLKQKERNSYKSEAKTRKNQHQLNKPHSIKIAPAITITIPPIHPPTNSPQMMQERQSIPISCKKGTNPKPSKPIIHPYLTSQAQQIELELFSIRMLITIHNDKPNEPSQDDSSHLFSVKTATTTTPNESTIH